MEFIAIIMALAAGAGQSVQAGVNNQLQINWAHHPALAALASFAVGTIVLLIYVLAARVPVPSLPGQSAPWQWIGGILGAYTVLAMVILVPRLGAGALIALVLGGQIGMALILDHFGLLGYVTRAFTWQRLLGVVLLVSGIYLIRKY